MIVNAHHEQIHVNVKLWSSIHSVYWHSFSNIMVEHPKKTYVSYLYLSPFRPCDDLDQPKLQSSKVYRYGLTLKPWLCLNPVQSSAKVDSSHFLLLCLLLRQSFDTHFYYDFHSYVEIPAMYWLSYKLFGVWK